VCWQFVSFKYFLRQIRNYIFSGYIIRKVQEWPNMLWFSVCNSDLEFMIANKLQKKNKTTSPCIEWAFIMPDPDGKGCVSSA
jgi:hypothetical protein